jgi:hypothetical protein
MLTNEEITKYISVFFDRNINSKHDFKNYEWPSLAKFIVQWRRDDIKKDNPDLEFWITKIAPSCVYQRKTSTSEEFSCVVCENRGFKRVGYLIRHYKEMHFEQMPANIFGENLIFSCKICKIEFTRKEYLTMHESSDKHKQMVAPGEPIIRKRNSKQDESNKESEAWYKKVKTNILQNINEESVTSLKTNEQEYFESKFSPKIVASSSTVNDKIIEIGLDDRETASHDKLKSENHSQPPLEIIGTQPVDETNENKDQQIKMNKENISISERNHDSIENGTVENVSLIGERNGKQLLKALSINLENNLKL